MLLLATHPWRSFFQTTLVAEITSILTSWVSSAWVLLRIYMFSLWALRISHMTHAYRRPDRMSHRKWRETKQQPSRARSGHQISCWLVSLHFLCDILSGRPVCAFHGRPAAVVEWKAREYSPMQLPPFLAAAAAAILFCTQIHPGRNIYNPFPLHRGASERTDQGWGG